MNTTPTDFPRVDADLSGDGIAEVTALGLSRTFMDDPEEGTAIEQALKHIAEIASVSSGVGRDVFVNCHQHGAPTGRLIVTPTGEYYDESNPSQRFHVDGTPVATPPPSSTQPPAMTLPAADQRPPSAAQVQPSPPAYTPPSSPAPAVDEQPPAASAAGELVRNSVPARAPGHRAARAEPARVRFITTDPVTQPAERGWRGMLAQTGIRIAPNEAEVARREDERLVSGHWPGLRTIAIVNPKGGSGKSMAAPALSAVFARYGGGGVLAWDNNETRGTLGWRTEQSHTHEATVLDLIPDAERLLSPTAVAGDIAGYVHHQGRDKYDVLRSDQSVTGDHEVTGDEVHTIHAVAARYYRLLVIDSGNNERAANWRAMLDHTDQLVVPCTNSEDTAEAAARMLEALHRRDDHSRRLAQSAVVIVSQRTPGKDENMQRIMDGFGPLVRAVQHIGYDPGLRHGHLAYDNLRRTTQRQWLAAAAAIARGL